MITAIQRGDTPDKMFRYFEKVKHIQKEEIHQFAQNMLNMNHRLSLFWLPSPEEKQEEKKEQEDNLSETQIEESGLQV